MMELASLSPILQIIDKLTGEELQCLLAWIGPPAPARLKELQRFRFIAILRRQGLTRAQIAKRLCHRFQVSESTAYACLSRYHFSGHDWKNTCHTVANLNTKRD